MDVYEYFLLPHELFYGEKSMKDKSDKTIDMTELSSTAKDFKQKKEEFETSFNEEVQEGSHRHLSVLLHELSKYGEVELTFDSNGWFCHVILLPMISNAHFSVKSDYKSKTAFDAVLQCRTRVKESIERLKGI